VIPTELAGEFVDRPIYGVLEVEALESCCDVGRHKRGNRTPADRAG
jgi:hypothetical protein